MSTTHTAHLQDEHLRARTVDEHLRAQHPHFRILSMPRHVHLMGRPHIIHPGRHRAGRLAFIYLWCTDARSCDLVEKTRGM